MMGAICALSEHAGAEARKRALAAGKSAEEADRAAKKAFEANFYDAANTALRINGIMGRIVKALFC